MSTCRIHQILREFHSSAVCSATCWRWAMCWHRFRDATQWCPTNCLATTNSGRNQENWAHIDIGQGWWWTWPMRCGHRRVCPAHGRMHVARHCNQSMNEQIYVRFRTLSYPFIISFVCCVYVVRWCWWSGQLQLTLIARQYFGATNDHDCQLGWLWCVVNRMECYLILVGRDASPAPSTIVDFASNRRIPWRRKQTCYIC